MKNCLYLFLLFSSVCFSQKNKTNYGNYEFETECFENNLDGTIVVKAWGLNNMNGKEALIEAKRKALNQIIFVGLHRGKNTCGDMPIVTENNARAKHEDYFNEFFKKNGEFVKYVESNNASNNDKNKVFYLTIKKSQLKKKLIEDGILKK